MFELIPFDRTIRHMTNFDPFRELDNMERSFFGNGSVVSAFRTDVSDTGDAFKLEAELPGFSKESVSFATAPTDAALTSPALTPTLSRRPITTACSP